jgi:hypothetical protein
MATLSDGEWENRNRPPLRRWATRDGLGGRRCSWGVVTTAAGQRQENLRRGLGGVDKFEPVSGGGEMDHSEETAGQLVVAGGDGAVDLQVTEHAFDAIALLVERAVHSASVRSPLLKPASKKQP